MKRVFCAFLLAVVFSCSKKPESSLEPGTPYYDFDAITHYHINIGEDEATSLYDAAPSTKEGKLSEVLGNGNVDMKTAEAYVSKLETLGFSKRQIPKSKMELARSVFSARECEGEWLVSSCIPVYRDIYVLRKTGKITGIAKICFDCGDYSFNGSKHQNEIVFGKCGEFSDLAKLSRN